MTAYGTKVEVDGPRMRTEAMAAKGDLWLDVGFDDCLTTPDSSKHIPRLVAVGRTVSCYPGSFDGSRTARGVLKNCRRMTKQAGIWT